jgi:alanyl-tRNA synthetase
LLESDVEILRYRKVKQKNQELYQVVFDKSPFYAEMGGQMGDSGYIESNGARYEIIDTKKENNLSIHILKSMPQDVSSIFYAVVDMDKRQQTACNHTATHILDYALRSVLGTHVEQKGSMVSSSVLRFDFSHFQKVTDEELRQVERLANSMVRQNIPLTEYRDIPIEQARTMGAMALFGEKYGDTVRVIQYGPSMELCGGTHVQATGEIGTIRIISESSVAAGIRRIEAVSAAQAEELLYAKEDLLRDMKNFFNNTPNLLVSVKKTIEENADLKKQVESYYQEKILSMRDHLLAQANVVNGVKLVVIKGEFSADMVKSVAFQIKNVSSEPLAVLGATYSQDKKPSLTVLLSDELVERGMNATQIVRDAAKEIQGGGGGQPFFAQAGGKKLEGLNSAMDKLMALFA